MFVLPLILIAVLFGFGFLHPIWWVAAAVLVYGATRHGRDRGGGRSRGGGSDLGDYRDYQERRDRQDRWDRRYSRQNRARWGARTVGTTKTAVDPWSDLAVMCSGRLQPGRARRIH